MSLILRTGESSQRCDLECDESSALSLRWLKEKGRSEWDVSATHILQNANELSPLRPEEHRVISHAILQHQLLFHPDTSRTITLALDASRMRILHPVAIEIFDGWALAWLREDTGRVSLEVTTITKRQWLDSSFVQPERRRVAEVWTSLDPHALRCAAPAIAPLGDGFAVAWREERGPVPGVYMQTLSAIGLIEGREIRVSTRGVAVEKFAPVLASHDRVEWACAYVERYEETLCVRLATLMRQE